VDFLIGLLQGVVCTVVSQAVVNITGVVMGRFRENTQQMDTEEMRRLLETLGATSANEVRSLVREMLGHEKRITDAQREDVAAVLISLAHGANLLNSQGGPRSCYVRCQDLLEQMLESIPPKRKAGEQVCPNHNWVLRRFLGMGTFGEVWLAENTQAKGLSRRAYKFFTHDGATDWLRQEKDSLLEIQKKLKGQPQIVELKDVTLPDSGYPFLALEYVEGGSLEDWILDARRSKRPLHKSEIVRGIVRAMAEAHRNGIHHGDLKPGNILLTLPPDVQPKITDFGLSSIDAFSDGEIAAETLEWTQVGTPMYWPPEASRSFAERRPALFDVFALGMIWYQLLVERIERPPYDFENELRAVEADGHTLDLIARCLAHPSRRFQDATELAERMDSVDLPVWDPVPPGLFDVQHLVREYVSLSATQR
jgi:serine/threonine protein kinase